MSRMASLYCVSAVRTAPLRRRASGVIQPPVAWPASVGCSNVSFGLFRSATSFFVGAAWIARQTRSTQGRRRLPGPPFFFMSRQCLHFRHSTARQPSHLPQRVRRVDMVLAH